MATLRFLVSVFYGLLDDNQKSCLPLGKQLFNAL